MARRDFVVYGNMSVKSKGVSLKWFKGIRRGFSGDIHLQQVGNHVVKMDADGKPKMAFSDTDITWGYPGSLSTGPWRAIMGPRFRGIWSAGTNQSTSLSPEGF
jgi:hypothetical protein